MITVVSLGTEKGDLTLRGKEALLNADEVLLRTARTYSAQTLDDENIPYETLDFLYDKSRNYDTLTKNIVQEIKRRGKTRRICYCVDGSGREDAAARILIDGGHADLIDGKSKASHFAACAHLCGQYSTVSAFDLAGKCLTLPLIIYDLTADNISDVKLLLAERFGDEAKAALIDGNSVKNIPLFEADRQGSLSTLTGLVLYEIPLLEKKRFDFEDAVAVLKRLRAPDGCPWDRVQTHESIRINAIEEAYELVDAIDLNDPDKMCEEAGDVLMQSLFHVLIEEEKGNFTVTDMLTQLCQKLITRHTHVFGQDKATGADGALSVWEKNKMTEKHQTTFSDSVCDVPQCFPALLRAQKIAKRTQKGGWDSPSLTGFEREFHEEYEELLKAFESGNAQETAEELGDVLMCVVNLARAVGADAEMSLLDTAKKVQKRYTVYENLVRADGKDVLNLTDEEKNLYYKRAKDASRT